MKILHSKSMGNSHQNSPYPRLKYNNNSPTNAPPQNVEDFERRWKAFIQSLDVTPQNIQSIDQLEAAQKIELLMNFESKNPKCSAFHYVTLIKGLRSCKMTNSKKKDEFQNAKRILSATEISLRTNNVGWVYDFLKHNGLEILVDYLSQTLLHMIKMEDIQISPAILTASASGGTNISHYPGGSGPSLLENGIADGDYLSTTNQSLRRIFDQSNRNSNRLGGSCRYRSTPAINRTSSSVGKSGKSHSVIVDSIKECIHLCLKCFRTILNNQRGCRMAFEYRDTINVITLCLLHPSYQTKSLVLDLLSAVCLIEGGHDRVLKAFDIFKAMTGEERRFETLMYYYRHHETLPLDDYNIDYAVSNMQFINIIVHSVEYINLRVYLQYEFTLLGLDDFLKKLQERPGDRLNRQVDAYLDNTVDCGVLLEDAESKENYVNDCERLEKEVSTLQERLTQVEGEKSRKVKEAEERVRKAEKEIDKAKIREEELSLLVESLRSKIRDINVNLSDRESNMQKEITDLNERLKNLTSKFDDPAWNSDLSNNRVNTTVIQLTSDNILPTKTDKSDDEVKMLPDENRQGQRHRQQSNALVSANQPVQNKHKFNNKQTQVKIKETAICDSIVDTPSSKEGMNHTTNIVSKVENNVDVGAGTGDGVDKKAVNYGATSVTSVTQTAPIIKWNILRSQQGTVFEEMKDGGNLEQQLDLECFEKIFNVPPPNIAKIAENEYDIPPCIDTIDGGLGAPLSSATAPNKNNIVAVGVSQKAEVQSTKSYDNEPVVSSSNGNLENTEENQDRISLLDKNRKKCLKVVVKFLKQERLLLGDEDTFREWGRPLACAIANMELPSEAADRLLYQLPSYQEIDMYRDIAGDNLNVLADEDRLVALLSCLDRVEMKLEAILYMDAFDETYFGLQEKIRTVALACKSVMDSQKLKKILEIVLAFGNRMNDSRRGKALGFRIQSLDVLPEYRSPDDKWSLMHYIVYSIEDKFPDLSNFTSELESVEDASRVSLCNMMAAVEELNTGLDRVAEELALLRDAVQHNPALIPMRLVTFVKENTCRVSQLKVQAEQARVAFIKTVEWFGEKDLQNASPDLFFGTLTRFMESFKKAMAENSRRKIGNANHKGRRHKERSNAENKNDHSRKKNRTRQINADGIMDDILAGLDFQPLQAGLHGKTRTNKRDANQSMTNSTYNNAGDNDKEQVVVEN